MQGGFSTLKSTKGTTHRVLATPWFVLLPEEFRKPAHGNKAPEFPDFAHETYFRSVPEHDFIARVELLRSTWIINQSTRFVFAYHRASIVDFARIFCPLPKWHLEPESNNIVTILPALCRAVQKLLLLLAKAHSDLSTQNKLNRQFKHRWSNTHSIINPLSYQNNLPKFSVALGELSKSILCSSSFLSSYPT